MPNEYVCVQFVQDSADILQGYQGALKVNSESILIPILQLSHISLDYTLHIDSVIISFIQPRSDVRGRVYVAVLHHSVLEGIFWTRFPFSSSTWHCVLLSVFDFAPCLNSM